MILVKIKGVKQMRNEEGEELNYKTVLRSTKTHKLRKIHFTSQITAKHTQT